MPGVTGGIFSGCSRSFAPTWTICRVAPMSIALVGRARCADFAKRIAATRWADPRRNTPYEGEPVESLFALAILAAVAWWFYKSGKRVGSRKGYHVGRSRRRRRR
jgi:hypothetical protein